MFSYEILVLLVAGLGAGVVTGLLGASAAMVAAPIIIIFLGSDFGYSAFVAVGISLAIDVFASTVTAYNFNKNKHIRLKPTLLILLFSILGAFAGSYFSSTFHSGILSHVMGVVIVLTGIHLMRRDINKEVKFFKGEIGLRKKFIKLIFMAFAGFFIGFFAGFVGTGGGIALLLILTLFLGYRIHGAIGTSVFVMVFIALSGAVGHIVYGDFKLYSVLIASVAGMIGAYYTSKYANKTSEEKLNKIGGFVILLLGLFLLAQQIFFNFAF